MKILERIVDGLVRQMVSIDDSQFGFVPGRGTTDAIFVVRQLLEKYLAENKRLLCLLCLCVRLFICALWSPAGKGLTSWLSFVVSNCEFVTFPLVSWDRCGI